MIRRTDAAVLQRVSLNNETLPPQPRVPRERHRGFIKVYVLYGRLPYMIRFASIVTKCDNRGMSEFKVAEIKKILKREALPDLKGIRADFELDGARVDGKKGQPERPWLAYLEGFWKPEYHQLRTIRQCLRSHIGGGAAGAA